MPRFSLAVLVSAITLAAIAAACGDQRKAPANPIVSAPGAGAESSPTLTLRADRRSRALHAIRSDNLIARHADHRRARPAYHRPVAIPGGNDAALTVTDARGVAVSRTVPVVASHVAPTAAFSAPAMVNEGENFTLAINNVYDASAIDPQSLKFAYDCGSGFGQSTSATSVQCPAANNG